MGSAMLNLMSTLSEKDLRYNKMLLVKCPLKFNNLTKNHNLANKLKEKD